MACDETNFDCTTVFSNTTEFIDNSAGISGGGLFWNDVEPQYETFDEAFSFYNNIATIYGNNIACFAEKMVNISFDEYQAQ